MKRWTVSLMVRAALILGSLGAMARADAIRGPGYQWTDLNHRSAYALNDAGQVVGVEVPLDDNSHALPGRYFVYQGYGPQAGSLQTLDPVAPDGTRVFGPTNTFRSIGGINASGVVAINSENGGSFTPDDLRASVVQGGVATAVSGVGSNPSTATITGINNSGSVVGFSYMGGNAPNGWAIDHAFVISQGQTHDLGTLGGYSSLASGINNAGQVVGTSDVNKTLAGTDPAYHAFLSDGQAGHPLLDLGTLGGTYSGATAINDHGLIVGSSNLAGDKLSHAFELTAGAMHDLGSLAGPGGYSRATGVNNAGEIVGSSSSSGGDYTSHAFLYKDGVMSDLNDLVKGLKDWVLTDALAINEHGQILVSAHRSYFYGGYVTDAYYHDYFDTFLLTPEGYAMPAPAPIPEPTTLALLAAGCAGAFARRCWTSRGPDQQETA